jgi:hypothetical protein
MFNTLATCDNEKMAMKLEGTGLCVARLTMLACLPIGILADSQQANPKIDFVHEVQPIIKAHCLQCHGGTNGAGALSLSSIKAMTNGGASGPSVTAGKSADSPLIQRIEGKCGKPRMPMGFGPLSPKDIQTIKDWIDQGCVEGVATVAKKHWAYQTPIKLKVPVVKTTWIKNEIDTFVFGKLAKNKLIPSPEAERTTLIRRLSLDLTGLPPTPTEVDDFIADHSTSAYEKVVDRLLASPHFGERMALPWLDAARYADSNGFQMDGDTYQYVWRDWVVNAYNSNMPFDQFTIKQLAGDLIPNPTQGDLVATGFNRNHMLNGEGGAIPEEQRFIGLFDRVDTTSTTWLGLTMTCTRCHDHKYDPLNQRDYFSMMAFFNNVPENGVPTDNDGKHFIAQPWIYAGTTDQMTKMKQLEEQLKVERSWVKPGEEDEAGQLAWEKTAQTGKKEIDGIIATEPAKRNNDQKNKLRSFFFDHGLIGDVKTRRDHRLEIDNQLSKLRPEVPRVMVMSDMMPRKTHSARRSATKHA